MMRVFLALFLIVCLLPMPVTAAPAEQTVIGLLSIPAIDLLVPIVPAPIIGSLNSISDHEAGWLYQTEWIYDDIGPVTLGGHSDLKGDETGIFARLGELQPFDEITVYGVYGPVVYLVSNVYETNVYDARPLQNRGVPTLELITCTGADLSRRLIVEAVIKT